MAAEAAEAVGVTESIEKEPETTAGETTSTEEIPQEVWGKTMVKQEAQGITLAT